MPGSRNWLYRNKDVTVMATTTTNLEAAARQGSGKGFARRTRLEGKNPGVVYGKFSKSRSSSAV